MRTLRSAALGIVVILLATPSIPAAYCSTSLQNCPVIGTVFSKSVSVRTTLTSGNVDIETDAQSTIAQMEGIDVVLTTVANVVRFHPHESVLNIYKDGALVTQVASTELLPSFQFEELIVAISEPTRATNCDGLTAWETLYADILPSQSPPNPATDLVLNVTYKKHQALSSEGPLKTLPDYAFRGNPLAEHDIDRWPFFNTDHYHVWYELRRGSEVLEAAEVEIHNRVVGECV